MRPAWKKWRHRCEWWLLRSGATIVPQLPRSWVTALGNAAGALACMVDVRGRSVALANLHSALGEEYPDAARRRLARQSYQQFARTMLELFWSPHLNRENFARYFEFEGLERARGEVNPDGPVIVVCLHYGNFEWLSLACGYLGYPATVLAQEFKNPRLDPTFANLRERSGHRLIRRKGGVMQLYKTLAAGGKVAVLIDFSLPPRLPTVAIDCFGMKTSATLAHVWLHRKTGAPLLPIHCEPLQDGRYRLVFHRKIVAQPGATDREIAQACWDSFEPSLRRNPAPWLWLYKQWRYRPTASAPERYPFYAQPSKDFDRRIREGEAAEASAAAGARG